MHTHTFSAGCLFLEDFFVTLLFICALPPHSPWHVFSVCLCLFHFAVDREIVMFVGTRFNTAVDTSAEAA
jgi:hypothetical protein